MKTTMKRMADADWDTLERDVVAGIRALAATSKAMTAPEHDVVIADKVANDLFLPNVKLLAVFCEAVHPCDEEDGRET